MYLCTAFLKVWNQFLHNSGSVSVCVTPLASPPNCVSVLHVKLLALEHQHRTKISSQGLFASVSIHLQSVYIDSDHIECGSYSDALYFTQPELDVMNRKFPKDVGLKQNYQIFFCLCARLDTKCNIGIKSDITVGKVPF